ncbi:MAG: hypothetical protein QOE36_738 [Gaiellaceae bacterium]|jgi:hypothetical protein|nr:hypothetical protein [Gaiellaceae bacterium]
MGIMNRRNAMLGWAVWNVGKRAAKKKAKNALPGTIDDTRRPNASAIASLLAAVGGVLWFWRKRGGDSPGPTGS